MRNMASSRGGTKQIWVVLVLTFVLVLCVGVLLWLVWSEPSGLPASVSEKPFPKSEASSSQTSSSSKPKSSSKIESSVPPPLSSSVPSSQPVQHSNVGVPTVAPIAQEVKNLTINAALTHDENATYYNVFINADGITLKNKLVTGDLVISESVANGAVTLENVVVKGRVLVNGAQTVTLRDVTSLQLIAQRGSGTTDYIVSGASTVHQMTATNQLTIDEGGLSGNYEGIKKLSTERGAPLWQQVTLLDGALEQIITNDATNLILSGHSSVETVIADAPTHIGGSGSVYNLMVCSDNVSYEKEPRNVTIKDNYDQPSEQNWAIGQNETAVNGGDHSGTGILTLSIPRNLTITGVTADSSVIIAFDSVSNATSYNMIYSVTNGSNTSNITNQQLSLDTNSYVIKNALIGQAGTVITFKVRADSSSSRYVASAYSDFCTKTVVQLDEASGLAANHLVIDSGKYVEFSFNAVMGAIGYTINYTPDIGTPGIISITSSEFGTITSDRVKLSTQDALVTGFTVTAHAAPDETHVYLDSTASYTAP